MSSREIISIHVGQAGVQTGSAIWHQYCKEHSIDLDGRSLRAKAREEEKHPGECEAGAAADETPLTPSRKALFAHPAKPKKHEIAENTVFFDYADISGQFVPRALFVDLEENVIDDMLVSPFGSLFLHKYLIKGVEDAANNYARGHYTVGRQKIELIEDIVRQMTEKCDAVQALIFNYAVGGGTGSGLGGLISNRLNASYSKTPQVSFIVYPSPKLSTAVVEPYNALLSTKDLIEYHKICTVLDNEAGYTLTRDRIMRFNSPAKPKPDYFNINHVVSKVISSITSGMRFTGSSQFTVDQLLTNLVPFPKLHFMTSSLSPIIAEKDDSWGDASKITEDFICAEATSTRNMLVSYPNFDVDLDRYLGVSMTFRGNLGVTKANAAVQKIKGDKIKFVSWVPTGFKISFVDKPITTIPGEDGMKHVDKGCAMIGNCVAIARPLKERIARKFDVMYSQRAFVHWYVGEGMEEGEFQEAREDLQLLVADYEATTEKTEESDAGDAGAEDESE